MILQPVAARVNKFPRLGHEPGPIIERECRTLLMEENRCLSAGSRDTGG